MRTHRGAVAVHLPRSRLAVPRCAWANGRRLDTFPPLDTWRSTAAENRVMRPIRFARSYALAGLLAASVAALPSLEWCPLAAMASTTCVLLPRAIPPASAAPNQSACEAANRCDGANACQAANTCESPLACAAMNSLACDREPDPLPVGDRVWCIRPPWSALTVRADDMPAPRASTPLATLVAPLVVAPPSTLARARFGEDPRPPTLRVAHAPPQPRAPPCA